MCNYSRLFREKASLNKNYNLNNKKYSLKKYILYIESENILICVFSSSLSPFYGYMFFFPLLHILLVASDKNSSNGNKLSGGMKKDAGREFTYDAYNAKLSRKLEIFQTLRPSILNVPVKFLAE